MRCFVRLPADQRPKVLVVPENWTFADFKAACAAKLCVVGDIVVLLGSNRGEVKIDIDSAPEVEALDEISPGDTLVILAQATGAVPAPAGVKLEEADVRQDSDDEDDGKGENVLCRCMLSRH